jgi:hypothetical protein
MKLLLGRRCPMVTAAATERFESGALCVCVCVCVCVCDCSVFCARSRPPRTISDLKPRRDRRGLAPISKGPVVVEPKWRGRVDNSTRERIFDPLNIQREWQASRACTTRTMGWHEGESGPKKTTPTSRPPFCRIRRQYVPKRRNQGRSLPKQKRRVGRFPQSVAYSSAARIQRTLSGLGRTSNVKEETGSNSRCSVNTPDLHGILAFANARTSCPRPFWQDRAALEEPASCCDGSYSPCRWGTAHPSLART